MIATVAIVLGSVIVLAAIEAPACAWIIGRLKRKARSYTDYSLHQPPVPDTDDEYLTLPPLVFPADVTLEELEQYAAAIEKAAIRAEFAAIVCEQFPQYRSFRAQS